MFLAEYLKSTPRPSSSQNITDEFNGQSESEDDNIKEKGEIFHFFTLNFIFERLLRSRLLYSKSPRIRTYFFESQAEIGSYFKGNKTNFKV